MNLSRETITTGIPILDTQHNKYFELVENLLDMYENKNIETYQIHNILNQIQEYAQDNFDTEELLMENEGYPALEEHRHKHDIFKTQIDGYFEELENEPQVIDFIERLRHLLVVWFEQQIKNDDMKLAAFLKQRGYGNKPST